MGRLSFLSFEISFEVEFEVAKVHVSPVYTSSKLFMERRVAWLATTLTATALIAAFFFMRRRRKSSTEAAMQSFATFTVPLGNSLPLAALLCSSLPRDFPSRKNAKALIHRGQILVEGTPMNVDSTVLAGGERVDYILAEKVKVHKARLNPQGAPSLELAWAHVDDQLAVCVKPSGISVQGDESANRLRYAVGWHLPPPSHLPDALSVARHAHRIDKMTGGLLVFARTHAALSSTGQAFAAHGEGVEKGVKKTYLAIVAGRLEGSGVIDAPVSGKQALTRWRSLSCVRSGASGYVSTLRLEPQTGRNHQLRRHLALELGCPILGDPKYLSMESRASEYALHLWASELLLDHPATGKPLHVVAHEPERFEETRRREVAAAEEMGEAAWAEVAERQAAARRRAAAMQPSVTAPR